MKTKLTIADTYMILNALPQVGPVTLSRLLNHFSGDSRRVLYASRSELRRVDGVGAKATQALLNWRNSVDLAHEKRMLQQFGTQFISWESGCYPPLLRQIYDPPIGLYLRGELPEKGEYIALVGSRRATAYGLRTAERLGYELAQQGVTVVSGLARGVDTAAHRGALAAGGKTIAVMGCGMDCIYPAENENLAESIATQGGLLTEFAFGVPVYRQNFPLRNRIVAGLCQAVVVVESAAKGGSMITARLGEENNRFVGAVPGRVETGEAEGCHALLKDGACLVRSADDILQELRPHYQSSKTEDEVAVEALPDQKDPIAALLCGGDWFSVDAICAQLQLSIGEVMSRLLLLEVDGKVMRRSDGLYAWKSIKPL